MSKPKSTWLETVMVFPAGRRRRRDVSGSRRAGIQLARGRAVSHLASVAARLCRAENAMGVIGRSGNRNC